MHKLSYRATKTAALIAFIIIKDRTTKAEVKRLDVRGKSRSQVERIDDGLTHQMNWEDYYIEYQDAQGNELPANAPYLEE